MRWPALLHLCVTVFTALASGQNAINADFASSISAELSSVFFDKEIIDNFGLKLDYTWYDLLHNITALNRNERGLIYRVVFVGRHGEGTHNVAERKYGSSAWDGKWSKMNGDGILTWGPDANLTALGRSQALRLHETWELALAAGLHHPGKMFSSPLSRALNTAQITFTRAYTPAQLYVMEDLREVIGVHTCDKRSDRDVLSSRFDHVQFEPSFTQADKRWTAQSREEDAEVRVRARGAMAAIMASECKPSRDEDEVPEQSFILSITSHSGFLRNLFQELDLGKLELDTGGMTGIVLEADCALAHRHSRDEPRLGLLIDAALQHPLAI